MRKRSILILLFFCLVTGPLQAQHFSWGKRRPAAARSRRVSRVLTKRKNNTFQQAQQAQAHSPDIRQKIDDVPYRALIPRVKKPQQVYPEMADFLSTRRQWKDYILANQNRRLVNELPREEQRFSQLTAQLFDLYQMQHEFSQPQQQYMKLLARQIPPDTQYLLLGEYHEEFIGEYVARLLPQLRNNNPNREIILLTEFLSDKAHQPLTWLLSPHLSVFSTAQAEQIPLIGLEAPFVTRNKQVTFLAGKDQPAQRLWASLEGMAIRNNYWLEIIRKQRQEHPDALFIIYAGAAHLAYNKPDSLGAALSGEKTFTALLLPENIFDLSNNLLRYTSPYDYLCLRNDLPLRPFIRFEQTQARQVGFDARLVLNTKKDDLPQYSPSFCYPKRYCAYVYK